MLSGRQAVRPSRLRLRLLWQLYIFGCVLLIVLRCCLLLAPAALHAVGLTGQPTAPVGTAAAAIAGVSVDESKFAAADHDDKWTAVVCSGIYAGHSAGKTQF